MPPAFIYFDLGNVLLNFSHERAARQMAEVAGISTEAVWQLVFADGDLENQCERGDLNAQQVYDIFCEKTNTAADFATLERAGSDIFDLNRSMVPLVGHLSAAKHRLGILSNTSSSHWNFVTGGQFGMLPASFEKLILSYEVRAMKPDRKIYQAAIEQAGVPAEEIFFTDDRPENVAGAMEAGIDAVQFHSAAQVAGELYRRGVKMNY